MVPVPRHEVDFGHFQLDDLQAPIRTQRWDVLLVERHQNPSLGDTDVLAANSQ